MASLLPAQAWAAPPGDRTGVQLPGLQADLKAKLDKVEAAKLEGWAGAPAQPPAGYEPSKVTPPAAGSANVALNPGTGGALVQAGTLPVSIGKASPTESNPTPPDPSGTWSVAVEARTATESVGIDGAIIKVTPPAEGSTPVDIQLDYKQFEDLYGTEWATRLELRQLPECFLTTPTIPECTTAKAVPTTNDPATGTVRATVDPATGPGQGLRTMALSGGAGPTVLAATDSASGAGGTYKATSLSPSGSWSAGGSGGGFSWSYPLGVPAAPAGPEPKIALSYGSQSVDGKTSVANGQASWIGDGWDYHPGFVERRYRPCSADLKGTPNNNNSADKKKNDLCWAGDNMVMSLGGSTTELVKDATTGNWIPADDDGSKVERLTDANVANGAKDGEYWRVTTREGTKYYFGRHDVDGAGTRPVTDSVFNVPVFGNHPGEPCYQSTFAASSCKQAWRWNLDYVEDVHGNALIIDWKREENRYSKNEKWKEKNSAEVGYVRGGYPSRITYGLRADNLSGAPAAKVEFTVDERCVKEGATKCQDSEFTSKNYEVKQPWWDTPSTLNCTFTDETCYVSVPTFWTRKRLTAITTYGQRTEGTTDLSKVDQWTLQQSFPKQRTDTHPPLWLESISRTGYGTKKDENGNQLSAPLPPVSFLANVQDMPNRVAKSANDATPDYDRLRVETIRNETGGEIYVDYSAPCPVGTTHPKPEENTGRCFPNHWSPDGDLETPPLEWFNKYVVDKVVEKDRVARQPDVTTSYTYEGDAAWAKDDDEWTKPELRTYNQWRGYASVVTTRGVTSTSVAKEATEQALTRTRYFRGMSGDAGRPVITVKDSTGTEVLGDDLPQYAGKAAETLTYTKAGGTIAARDLNWYESKKTGSRPRTGTTDLEAFRVNTRQTDQYEAIDGGTRLIRAVDTYEPVYGLKTSTETEAKTSNGSGGWTVNDQSCSTTTYVHNTTKYLIGLVQNVRATSGTCAQAATGTLLSQTRTAYDALNAFGTAPVKGLVFQTDTQDGAGTGWITTGRFEYDALGRVVKSYDPAGNAVTTTFTPATGPAFTQAATNTLNHKSTTKVDPGRGLVLELTDQNNRKITSAYDPLGRTTAVWTPSQNPATDKARQTFDYQITEHEPPAVTSRILRDNGTYESSIEIYDGLLRPRQTQAEAVGGGRLVNDKLYNANGTVRRTNNAYYAEGEPDRNIFVPETDFHVPNATATAYDGLGRPVRNTTLFAGTDHHSDVTAYGGNWTLQRSGMSANGSTALPGSQSTKTWTDVLNRTTLIQKATANDLTTWNDTTYTYDVRGKLAKVTDAAANNWTYTYDARGRLTGSTDPDMGAASFGYNNLDQQEWSQNSAGKKTYTLYDKIGRPTESREDSATGPLAASWVYDTLAGGKGKPVSSTSYSNGAAYKSEITGYDTEYRPTGTKITIPDNAATKGLAGTYAYSTTYTPTGAVQSTTLPATPGGLAAEKLITRYNADGLPQTVSGLSWYTAEVAYSPFGEVLRTASGNAPNRVWTTTMHDPNTGRVTQSIADRETPNDHRISALSYTYDVAGNPTSITDTRAGGLIDRQCFSYSPIGQLTQAWTGKTAACTGPSLNDVTAGPDGDGYWQSYKFDAVGNRTELVNHHLTNSALDQTTTYSYGVNISPAGQAPVMTKPHALTKADKKQGATPLSQSTYEYDAAGNTKTRKIDTDTQALTWDRNNKLAEASSPGIGAVAITGLSGKCLDVDGGRTADGTAVQLWPCNESKAQQWRLSGNTVRALDKCLTAQGGKAVVATCNGGPEQKFVYRTADKTLYNAAANACVDVPNGNDADGTDLLIWACAGATNQQWNPSDTTTKYIYDASGTRLIEETGSSRTLYLGETEFTVNKAGQAMDAVRYYGGPGGVTTTRQTYGKATGHKLTVLLADHHNTATVAVEQTAGQPVTRRKFDPYGNQRGGAVNNWPGSRTFLGTGVDDASTGLTHIGAREYEPATGRFISVDPVIDVTNPLQMNGYNYANNNPISQMDPSGLESCFGYGYCGGGGETNGLTIEEHNKTKGNDTRPPRVTVTVDKQGDIHVNGGRLLTAEELKVRYPAKKTYYERMKTWLSTEKCRHIDDQKTAFCQGAADLGLFDYERSARDAEIGDFMLLVIVPDAAAWASCASLSVKGCAVSALDLPWGKWAKGIKILVKGEKKLDNFNLPGVKCAKCFLAGTDVLMADGTTKNIEDVEVGDEVKATDPETGETGSRQVTNLIVTEDDKYFNTLSIATEDGIEELTATHEHPFWSPSANTWLEARELTAGASLLTDDGTTVIVTANKPYTQHARTYNLTVDDLHTYYVLAGSTPVLVHNSDCLFGSPLKDGIFGQSKAATKDRIQEVVDFFDMNGRPPAMTHQGKRSGRPVGEYGNGNGQLPDRPLGYYTESDVWPSAQGTGPRGSERLVFGKKGEVYYTTSHYDNLIRLR
ncbi:MULTISPECIES: ricin-type beta-trefoil lectin domain protein [unclassified Streptomyces]|uniref:ricin-type beta-trefoil lectin domain protein n=1 Tax=unclassified Streptomyces TaxID=2593676 RepID=UPI00324F4EE9